MGPELSPATLQATEAALLMDLASFSSLPSSLVQDILRHLGLEEQGRAACVSKLCASAVLPLAPALAHYVTAGDALAVRRLLQKPDGRPGLDNLSCEDKSSTPLQTALAQGSVDIVAALLEAGAALEALDTNGATALVIATKLGHSPIVEALLAAGAALEAEDKGGMRALHYAAQHGRLAIVESLLRAGAALEAAAGDGSRPLQYAAANGHALVLETLLAAGLALEADNKYGCQPLHGAAENGQTYLQQQRS